jgi:anti-sigma B factor antagonist
MGPPISVREGHLLTVRIDRDNDSLLVRASGEIDHANVGMLEEELGRAFGSDASVIVLDMGDVDFIGVAGVHVLLSGAARARENGNRLSIWLGSGAPVRRTIELCGVESALPLTG